MILGSLPSDGCGNYWRYTGIRITANNGYSTCSTLSRSVESRHGTGMTTVEKMYRHGTLSLVCLLSPHHLFFVDIAVLQSFGMAVPDGKQHPRRLFFNTARHVGEKEATRQTRSALPLAFGTVLSIHVQVSSCCPGREEPHTSLAFHLLT